jgi:hypothetical protein
MDEYSSRTHDVFLSYSSKDKTWADMACAVLERHRVRCWIAPRDITPGDEWAAAIMKGLNGSRMMVLIFSGHANASKEVRREVERASSRGMTILAMRIEDVRPDGAMEYALGNRHWLDAFTPPIERQLELLAQSVQTLLVKDAVPRVTGNKSTKTTTDIAPKRLPPWKKWPLVLTGSLFGLIALAVLIMNIGAKSSRETMEKPSVDKPHGPPSDSVGASQFVPLFNGKDLSGWRLLGNPKHTWKVLQWGILEGSGPPTASTLTTDFADFGNFHLRVETKIADGPNSGIAFRITESNGGSASYMAHIAGTDQDKRSTGCLSFSMIGTRPIILAEADPVVRLEPGEWFTEEVIADGNVISVIVKGVEVVKHKILQRKLISGAIGLQCRGNSRVVFRKIEIKKLIGAGR